jgi:mannose-1-phosphate guanylyltransferase
VPKPLVPIGDGVAIDAVLACLGAQSPVVVNAYHLASAVVSHGRRRGVHVIEEPRLLGPAGGLANAASALGAGDVLVWNADILADLDGESVARAHVASGGAATLVVAPRARGEGTVGVGHDGRVVRLRGEVFGEELSGGDFVGIHVVGEELRASLPAEGCLVGDVYLPALRAGRRLATHVHASGFVDVGSLGAYLSANAAWLSRRGLRAFVHEEARLAPGVRVERAIVGRGADVRADVIDAVVWPGTVVTREVRGAIAADRGTVRVTESDWSPW